MTVLLSCKELSKSHSHAILFDKLSFTVHKGDQLGIIGPNGSGKSTLLQIIAKQDKPDYGEVVVKQSLRIGYVPQFSEYPDKELLSIILEVLKDYFPHQSHDDQLLTAEIVLAKMGFENSTIVASTLSGGWKKRLDIAKAMAIDPDILLLDEPTNHLDIASIVWLEELLQRGRFSYIVVSHDRLFLDRVTNRMIEVNRAFPKGLFAHEGNYSAFLEKRSDFLTALEQYEQGLRSKVRNEVAWLRQSPAARTTKQQARIQQAHALQDELQTLRSKKARPKEDWEFDAAGLQSRKLIVAKNLTKQFDQRVLFKGLDLLLSPGSRLGIAGDNGSGKTTLLRMLAGEEKPDLGTLKYAEGIRIVYFDQHREKLPETHTLKECLAPNGDMVEYRGKQIHVNGWAKRFHFHTERMLMPVSQLSGGERARILLARLMLQQADVLLLDEPTNDLDIETLEVLEESLLDFPGAVVLITHDRRMLDTVSTEIIGLGCGEGNYQFASVEQWEQAKQEWIKKSSKPVEKGPAEAPKKAAAAKQSPKLTFKEQQELQQISNKIEASEKEIEQLEALAAETATQTNPKKLEELCKQLADAHHQIDKLFHRWQELENKKN